MNLSILLLILSAAAGLLLEFFAPRDSRGRITGWGIAAIISAVAVAAVSIIVYVQNESEEELRREALYTRIERAVTPLRPFSVFYEITNENQWYDYLKPGQTLDSFSNNWPDISAQVGLITVRIFGDSKQQSKAIRGDTSAIANLKFKMTGVEFITVEQDKNLSYLNFDAKPFELESDGKMSSAIDLHGSVIQVSGLGSSLMRIPHFVIKSASEDIQIDSALWRKGSNGTLIARIPASLDSTRLTQSLKYPW